MKKIALVTFLILLIDQLTKIYVKTNFNLNEGVSVIPGFEIKFVENPGMAYGLQFGGIIGKYFLVMVRIAMVGGMIYLFRKWLREGASNYLIIPMAMIFAGAIGNLIDGMFYGLIFDMGMVFDNDVNMWIGYDGIAQFVPFGHGYSHFMKGCVVDMLYFPLVDWYVPESWPIIGGRHIEFFKYIFNIADSSITIGAIFLYIFRKKAFPNGFEL